VCKVKLTRTLLFLLKISYSLARTKGQAIGIRLAAAMLILEVQELCVTINHEQ
jgi:hypothetical protein